VPVRPEAPFMTHVVREPTPPFHTKDGALEIHQIPAATDNLVWLLVPSRGGEVVAVDGPDAKTVLEYCAAHGLELTTILNTHTHFDHIGINAELERMGRLSSMRVIGPKPVASQVPGLTEAVDEGDVVRIGDVEGRVMLTEGHIDGHVSYLFSDALFCGDTLFGGGCGYLFDGPPAKMHASLCRLAELDGEVRVCCAHEYTQDNLRFAWSVEPDNPVLAHRIQAVWSLRGEGRSTLPSRIDLERQTNPFLRPHAETLRRRVAEAMPDRRLGTDEEVFAATRALKDRKDYRALKDEDLPIG
jgi:hydroxyacylglutathione hydrolase